jgi:putative ABC transport system permease protein
MIVAHGLGAAGFSEHEDKPFRVAGILKKTGTPVDRTVHVSLEGIEAIHIGWETGAQTGPGATADEARAMDLQPKAITAALLGLKSKFATFRLQRKVNEFRGEPLLAVIPGVALHELWGLIGIAETALGAISLMVVVTAMLGMATTIFASLNERRREMAILRALGAQPRTIFGLLLIESAMLSVAGAVAGALLLYAGLSALRPVIDDIYGIYLPISLPSPREWWMLAAVAGAGVVAGLPPAIRAYRLSLADGMTVKL